MVNQKPEVSQQHVSIGKCDDNIVNTTSEAQCSEDKSKSMPCLLPPIYTAAVHNLPTRLQSRRSIIDILKDFPKVQYISIKVLVNGIALISSKDPNILGKLRVLKESIKEPITIIVTESKPKEYVKKGKSKPNGTTLSNSFYKQTTNHNNSQRQKLESAGANVQTK